jgi:hypothetical protein
MNARCPTPHFLAVSIFIFCFASTVKAGRTDVDLANDWKFIKQDVDSTAPTEQLGARSRFHTLGTISMRKKACAAIPQFRGGYFRGACWYARTLDCAGSVAGKAGLHPF